MASIEDYKSSIPLKLCYKPLNLQNMDQNKETHL